jgi:hypothetical protein
VAEIIRLDTKKRHFGEFAQGELVDVELADSDFAHVGASQDVVFIDDEMELAAWRTMASKLRELEDQVRYNRSALELLPDCPDRNSAIFGLAVALERIQLQFANCFAQANRLEGRLTFRSSVAVQMAAFNRAETR